MGRVCDMSHTIDNQVLLSGTNVSRPLSHYSLFNLGYIFYLAQDQLSADMYSFVAKEIDYANYFQTVRVHKGKTAESL